MSDQFYLEFAKGFASVIQELRLFLQGLSLANAYDLGQYMAAGTIGVAFSVGVTFTIFLFSAVYDRVRGLG